MFNNVLATIPVCIFPREIVVNASGTRAYVYCHDGGYPGSAFGIVSVINTSTNSVISTTPLNNVGLPMRMTINPSGTRLFVGLVIRSGPRRYNIRYGHKGG